MGVHKVKDAGDFKAQLASAGSKLVVVDFFATWCGPCKMISPVLDKMSEELASEVVFLKVDVDENEDIAADHKVTVMPTFLLFKNQQKVDEFSGANESKLKELIHKNKIPFLHLSDDSGDGNGSIDLCMSESTGIATLCINNDKKRNAINDKMMEQLSQVITQLEQWTSGKAVIIYGKNGFFSSGVDLEFVAKHMTSRECGYHYSRLMHLNLSRLQSLSLLTVAIVEGQALGGGAEILTACDIRLMTRSAKIGFVQIRVGVTPGWSGGARLVRICGYTKALDLLMSGRVISATEALDLGFVWHIFNEMTSSDQLVEETKHLLKQYFNDFDINFIKYLKNSIL